MICKCDCKNEWQDKRYGKDNRVHNLCKASVASQIKLRCSVCNRDKTK